MEATDINLAKRYKMRRRDRSKGFMSIKIFSAQNDSMSLDQIQLLNSSNTLTPTQLAEASY
jgi:hypothetical protein